jgi:hypothetical protein
VLASLVPAVDVDGPRARLGLVWAAITAMAVMAGAVTTAVVFAGVALAAAGQASRSWKTGKPHVAVAIGGATACALASAAGPLAVLAAAAATVIAALIADRAHAGDGRTTAAIALVVGLAAASPGLVRGELGAIPALVLLVTIHAVDASAFVVGSGASNKWEGPIAGVATAAAIGLAVAAAFVPPFRGLTPWLLAILVAVLAPLGGVAATALLGRAEAPVPALRRLDAWLVAGPVWAVVARLALDLR